MVWTLISLYLVLGGALIGIPLAVYHTLQIGPRPWIQEFFEWMGLVFLAAVIWPIYVVIYGKPVLRWFVQNWGRKRRQKS